MTRRFVTARRAPVALALLVLGLAAGLGALPAAAQSGGVYEITRSTVDGGGSMDRSTGSIIVRGSIGQPDVGASAAGDRLVAGGFWASGRSLGALFRDGFETGDTSAWSQVVGTVASQGPVAAETQATIPPQTMPSKTIPPKTMWRGATFSGTVDSREFTRFDSWSRLDRRSTAP
ncbi:MAG: hypothetical protein AAGC60_22850 [Acidobacteriota bacterium]